MQITTALLFLLVWLVVFWCGSLAFEVTGLSRSQARFQALSALTGTGFTTAEAEQVVSHPRCRSILAWLIFIGNTGIAAFIILLISYARSGIKPVSALFITIMLALVLFIVLLIAFRVFDKLSNWLVALLRRGKPAIVAEGIVYQAGGYGLSRVRVTAIGLSLGDIPLAKRGVTILAIERGGLTLPSPKPADSLQEGDFLLCYGRLKDLLDNG